MRGNIIEQPIVPMPPSEYEITVCEKELTLLRSCVIRTLDLNRDKLLNVEIIACETSSSEGDILSKHITSLCEDLQRLGDDLRDLQENGQFNVGRELL